MPTDRYSGEEIVLRARSRLGERRYHLLRNNCEHFCSWCQLGECRSEQVEALMKPALLLSGFMRALRRELVVSLFRLRGGIPKAAWIVIVRSGTLMKAVTVTILLSIAHSPVPLLTGKAAVGIQDFSEQSACHEETPGDSVGRQYRPQQNSISISPSSQDFRALHTNNALVVKHLLETVMDDLNGEGQSRDIVGIRPARP